MGLVHFILLALALGAADAQMTSACSEDLQTCFTADDFAVFQGLFDGTEFTDEAWSDLCSILEKNRPCLKEKHAGSCAGEENAEVFNSLIYLYPLQCTINPGDHEVFQECAENNGDAFVACDNDLAIMAMADVEPPLTCETMTTKLNCIEGTFRESCGETSADFMHDFYTISLWLKYGDAFGQCDKFDEVLAEIEDAGGDDDSEDDVEDDVVEVVATTPGQVGTTPAAGVGAGAPAKTTPAKQAVDGVKSEAHAGEDEDCWCESAASDTPAGFLLPLVFSVLVTLKLYS